MFLFSFNNWAQNNIVFPNEKTDETFTRNIIMDAKNPQKNMKVKYYLVEETVSLRFGGHTTVYKVTKPSMVNTYNLGPNSTRIVTPVYEKSQQVEKKALEPENILKAANTKTTISDVSKRTDTIASIDVVNEYEKAADIDMSIEMLKMVGNYYFFNNLLVKAEKCYTKLFNRTSKLLPAFYYHYAVTLQAVGKTEKSTEYFKKFRLLTINNTQ